LRLTNAKEDHDIIYGLYRRVNGEGFGEDEIDPDVWNHIFKQTGETAAVYLQIDCGEWIKAAKRAGIYTGELTFNIEALTPGEDDN
jgi:hypothetical protein